MLKAAQQESSLLMAAAADRRRLVVLVSAKNERRAIRKIWKRLDDALSINVLRSRAAADFTRRDATAGSSHQSKYG